MSYNIHATIPWDYTVDSINTTGVKLTAFEKPEFRSAPKDIIVYVKSVGDYFKLDFDSSLTADGISIVTYVGGTGRWIRLNIPNEQFLRATHWAVSPATGSDENTGWGLDVATADAHPLATMTELNRRLVGYKYDNTCADFTGLGIDIHLMDDIPDSAFTILTNLKQINDIKYLRIRGNTKQIDSAGMNATITAVIPAVPATNTFRQIAIAGIGLKPAYIGKMIQTVNGLKTAFIVKQTTPDVFYISEPVDGGSTLDGATNGSPSDFSVGDHVNIVDLVRMSLWPYPTDIVFPLLGQLRISAYGSTVPFGFSLLGNMQGLITQCMLGDGVLTHEFEFNFDGGHSYILQSCIMFATHGNSFTNGSMQTFSCAVLINGDGPFLDNFAVAIGYELLFTPFINGTINGIGHGFRTSGWAPCSMSVDDIGVICSLAMNGVTFILYSTHNGEPGNFTGANSNSGPNSFSRWYGSGNTSLMLVLGRGTRSKFPAIGYTAVTSFPYQINVAGQGITDIDNNFNFSDIPIIDLSTMSIFQDSTPQRF